MTEKFIYVMIAVVLDSLAGLSGGVLPNDFVHRHISSLLAFAAGTLVGATFLDLLPEALSMGLNPHVIMLAALTGFIVFYVVESFLGSHAAGQSGHKHSHIGPLILVGDALHNAADGIAIAAAFLADVKTGIATTIAVIVHELPQEIGDYTILISHGYTRRRALMSLLIVQCAAVLGAIAALLASAATQAASPFLMAASAGGFLYIAAADLLPELHRRKGDGSPFAKLASFSLGLGVIALLALIAH